MKTNKNRVIYYYADPICKLSCKFCYARSNTSIETLETTQIKQLIQKAKSHGFNHFGLTGGNPLERSDIEEILLFLKKENMVVRVDLHGLGNSFELIKKYGEYIDWLGLPLDGHIAAVHDFNRDIKGHYKIILTLIKKIQSEVKNIKLKIHTVLTLRNYASVLMMESLIENISPEIWSIYKYFPAGIGYKNRNEFSITPELFQFAINNLPHKINNTIVDIPGDEIHDRSFLLVSSNGELYGCFNPETQQYRSFGYFDQSGFENALNYYGNTKISELTKREFNTQQ